MVLVNKLGLMEPNTQGNGVKTELTVKESSFMLMAMYMMAFGQMIRQMAQEFTSM
jgi:hypothetical protein